MIAYFKALAQKNGIPYQNLINLYLRECAESAKTLTMKWGWSICDGPANGEVASREESSFRMRQKFDISKEHGLTCRCSRVFSLVAPIHGPFGSHACSDRAVRIRKRFINVAD